MNNFNFRTDMADERVDEYLKHNNLTNIEGVEVKSEKQDNYTVTTVNVLNENGANVLSKDIGKYITMQINDINYLTEEQKQKVIQKLSEIVLEFSNNDKSKSVMIVGLGNLYVTPDSLGPKVVQNVNITRHLIKFAKDLVAKGTRQISAISPGVLGTTGIETSEIIESVVKSTKPDFLIVIDSLISQSMDKVGCTIQLGNTGIVPGAGVRNKRSAINEKTLKIPVIAIGVPTVVDMATITNDTVEKLENSSKIFISSDKNNRYEMISETLDTENYIVTPKEIDEIVEKVSEIISSGLNVAL